MTNLCQLVAYKEVGDNSQKKIKAVTTRKWLRSLLRNGRNSNELTTEILFRILGCFDRWSHGEVPLYFVQENLRENKPILYIYYITEDTNWKYFSCNIFKNYYKSSSRVKNTLFARIRKKSRHTIAGTGNYFYTQDVLLLSCRFHGYISLVFNSTIRKNGLSKKKSWYPRVLY